MRKPGDRIDRYTIEAILGRGGMGEVYEATDTRLGRKVALKVLRPGSDAAANLRMMREARAAASLEHPNAVVVYDVGEADGETYLAMELVRGKPLRSFVGDGVTPLDRRVRWLVEIARALGAAHRAGIVHRDVKPDNVMIRSDGTAKVLDFGIARRESKPVDPSAPTVESEALATVTEAGVIVGTPRYASPEQLRGDHVDGGTDQFGWGILAYELLTGKPPWTSRDGVHLISQILSTLPPPLETKDELPKAVERAILRSLEKDKDERFPTIDAAADAIEPFAEEDPVGSGDRARTASRRPPKKQAPAIRVAKGTARVFFYLAAALGTLMILAIIVGAFQGNLKINLGDGDEEAAEAGAAANVVETLACAPAKIEGKNADEETAAAIGIGACARLATEVGTGWRVEGGTHPLDVRAVLGNDEAKVTLRVGEEEATATAPTPLGAVTKAVAELAPQLRAPPMPEFAQRSWGATDEEGARKIERAWLRTTLYVLENDEAEIRDLVAAFPESSWSHLLLALVLPRGGAESKAAIEQAMAKLGNLTPSRQKGLRGVLLFMRSASERQEAMQQLRAAYQEAPDDPDIAGLYAAVAAHEAPEEGYAVIDRLADKFPTRSIVPLTNAVSSAEDLVPERDAKYLARLHQILPESRAWWHSTRYQLLSGNFEEARQTLAFGERLGQAKSASGSDGMRAAIELAALRPAAARELAKTLLSDPRGSEVAQGGAITVASYAMEGRLVDADSALVTELFRQRDAKAPLHALRFAIQDLRQRRVLGRPPPDRERLDWIERTLGEAAELPADEIAYLRTELALARDVDKASREKSLAAIEALAKDDLPERRRQSLLLATLPLVRAVQGDEAAIRLWRAKSQASLHARVRAALDAAFAFEGDGDDEGAIAAYRLAIHPLGSSRGMEYVGGRLRLAILLKKGGREGEAAELSNAVEAVWKTADAEVRDAFTRKR